MEFEELQVIWNSQNDEKLFAIDEKALQATIRRKSRSIDGWLKLVEWMMIIVNLITGVALIVDANQGSGPTFRFVLAAMYLAYGIFAVYRLLTRRKEEVRFEPTMLGDLDKAIWRVNYLIRQGHGLFRYYLLPLMLVASATLLYDSKSPWSWLMPLILLPVAYYGMRWEYRKWHQPKQRDLQTLREKLLAAESPHELS